MARRQIEFRILGPLEVRVDGVSRRIGGPKQRALLAMLLLQANRVVSRDRLIDELVDERTEAPEHALRIQVSRLRKVLGLSGDDHARLVARPPGYLLRVELGELDLHRFEELFEEGRQALDDGDPKRASLKLREAEALWVGRPLADLEFEPFARVEVERLEQLRLAALEERIEAELALGQHPSLVPELESLVAEHPLRERLRAQLMLALYRSGRQADALETYRAARSLLAERLALDPSPRLKTLERAILRQEATLELPGAVATAEHVASPACEVPPEDGGSSAQDVARGSDTAPSPGPGQRVAHWKRKLVLGAGGIAVAGLIVAVTMLNRPSNASLASVGAGVAIGDEASGHLVKHIPGSEIASPAEVIKGNGSFWVWNLEPYSMVRIAPSTGRILERISSPFGGDAGGYLIDGRNLWFSGQRLVRMDIREGRESDRYRLTTDPLDDGLVTLVRGAGSL